jgi:hypothetical protein
MRDLRPYYVLVSPCWSQWWYTEKQTSIVYCHGYSFINIIHYADNLIFGKQHKSASNTSVVRFILWGTDGFLYLEKEKHSEKPETIKV